jgi:hypothetical protein
MNIEHMRSNHVIVYALNVVLVLALVSLTSCMPTALQRYTSIASLEAVSGATTTNMTAMECSSGRSEPPIAVIFAEDLTAKGPMQYVLVAQSWGVGGASDIRAAQLEGAVPVDKRQIQEILRGLDQVLSPVGAITSDNKGEYWEFSAARLIRPDTAITESVRYPAYLSMRTNRRKDGVVMQVFLTNRSTPFSVQLDNTEAIQCLARKFEAALAQFK